MNPPTTVAIDNSPTPSPILEMAPLTISDTQPRFIPSVLQPPVTNTHAGGPLDRYLSVPSNLDTAGSSIPLSQPQYQSLSQPHFPSTPATNLAPYRPAFPRSHTEFVTPLPPQPISATGQGPGHASSVSLTSASSASGSGSGYGAVLGGGSGYRGVAGVGPGPRLGQSSKPRAVPGQRGFWVYQETPHGTTFQPSSSNSRPHSAPHQSTAVGPSYMSLTSAAPVLPNRHYGMSYPTDDRAYTSPINTASSQPFYPRPPSSHSTLPPLPVPALDPSTSPDRIHSSHGYHRSSVPPTATPQTPNYPHDIPPPGSAHGYPPPPMTPVSAAAFPGHPSGGSYYGLTQTPTDPQATMPSPPQTSNGRPVSANFTPDGNPIVPVGISGGKMFQCRGYGDCDKVFTRSEHLARHVRKHTGERPFPCHCGKAFSRLDNLRQHAATVHADQAPLNDAMLSSLAPVHATLSARANRDQRKRGEVVEVPKNAVERPRHAESMRKDSPGGGGGDNMIVAAYPPYPDQGSWDQHGRPRTSGDYNFHQQMEHSTPMTIEAAGPSRRPVPEGYPQQPYYDTRPPTAPGTGSSGGESMGQSQVQYFHRPVSNGRDAVPPQAHGHVAHGHGHGHAGHYAESEPPSSSHGHPPQSPMYPPGTVPHPSWSSPPPPHNGYPDQANMYALRPEYPYPDHQQPPPPPQQMHHTYGPPPPGSAGNSYSYPPQSATSYYGPNQPFAPNPPGPGVPQHQHQQPQHQQQQQQQQQPQHGYQGSHYGQTGPHESPFQYHAPPGSSGGEYTYPQPPATATHHQSHLPPPTPTQAQSQSHTPTQAHTGAQGQKRRAEEASPASRKIPRPSSAIPPPPPSIVSGPPSASVSAPALSSMQTRPLQEISNDDNNDALWFPPTTERRSSLAISALLGSPQLDHRPRPLVPMENVDVKSEQGTQGLGSMEEKAKALLGSSH